MTESEKAEIGRVVVRVTYDVITNLSMHLFYNVEHTEEDWCDLFYIKLIDKVPDSSNQIRLETFLHNLAGYTKRPRHMVDSSYVEVEPGQYQGLVQGLIKKFKVNPTG